jgi:integrase
MIDAKTLAGRSRRYTLDLISRLNRFCRDFGKRLVASVGGEELENWIHALPFSPQTRVNYRTIIGTLFGHAVKRRMLESNPVLFTEKPKVVDQQPEIFTVDQLRPLLETAKRIHPDVVPMLAIGAFAGLRDSEIAKLDWSEVKLNVKRPFIDVKAAKAKSARRRIVDIQPNLSEWLRPYAAITGPVVPIGAKGKLRRVRKAAGLTSWPANGLRHSYASYRLAATNNAAAVAIELGHTTAKVIYAHYRAVVLSEEAERYWAIKPAPEAENVVTFANEAQA